MGIDPSGMQFLARAKASGVDFRSTLTIGRQQLYGAHRAAPGVAPVSGFAEPLFGALGAESVDSLDASDYEGANLVADLNFPLPESWTGRYTAVFDGGSLEHLLDVPGALRNLMSLVRPGGHLLAGYPANNQVGHGLYQFSPELFFRTLTPANGFQVEEILLVERSWWTRRSTRWWQVRDPSDAGRRVEMAGRRPSGVFVRARRLGDLPTTLAVAQQSDYARAWESSGPAGLARWVDSLPWPAPALAAEVLRRRHRVAGYARLGRHSLAQAIGGSEAGD